MPPAIDQSHPRCPSCDYDLTGLSRPICPECGMELSVLDLMLPPRRRWRGWWWLCLMLLAVPVTVLVAVVLIWVMDRANRGIGGWLATALFELLAVLAAPIPILASIYIATVAAQQVCESHAKRRPRDGLLDVHIGAWLLYVVGFTALQWLLLGGVVWVVWLLI